MAESSEFLALAFHGVATIPETAGLLQRHLLIPAASQQPQLCVQMCFAVQKKLHFPEATILIILTTFWSTKLFSFRDIKIFKKMKF
jgi:hypothetical protein